MKKLFTKSVKEFGLKALIPLMILFLFPVSNYAQLYPGTVDIGIFESTTAGQMEIRIKPTDATTYVLTNMQFTVKWAEGTNNITAGAPMFPYLIQAQGSPVLDNGYYYQIFATAGGFAMSWTGGQEYVVATFTYSENCGEFEIADDAWTNANNGVYYIEILGFDATGTIYEPIVNNCGGNPVSVTVTATPGTVCEGEQVQLEAVAVDGSGSYTYSWASDPAGFTSAISNPSANPTVTTTYTVTVDDGIGTATDEVTVTVNPNPVASAGADQTICEGDCVWLSGSGTGNYMWSTGETDVDIYVCPIATTTYGLTITDANGCIGTDDVTITVLSGPVAAISGDNQICMGDCATLTASGGVSYDWSTGETTETIVVCPTTITLYTVTVYDANGCYDEAYVEVWFKATAVADAGPDVTICENECITLTACCGEQYQWSSGTDNGFFFSEYGEGSSNNKYLELYNGTGHDILLSDYRILTNYNGNPWSSWYDFPTGVTLAPGDVWVIANADSDPTILAEADETFTYGGGGFIVNFNGDDVRALVKIVCGDTTIVDIIGRYDLQDPGSGWEVAGEPDGTLNHTLVRKSTVCMGNYDWDAAAGTNATDSEWIVYPQNEWTYLGSHTGCPATNNTASLTVCPTTTTTYTVTVTNIDGCTASDDVTVTVLPIPTVDAGADVTICEGDCTTLTGSGNGSFMWSNGETTATISVCPTYTYTYTLVVTTPDGCCNHDEVVVTVMPAGYADAGPDQAICEGNCANLAANGNGDFMWSTGETSADINVCPTVTTTYTLTVTTVDGCTATDEVVVNVSASAYADAGPDQTICEGECTMLSASGGGTYQWSTGETTGDIYVCPSVTTTYILTVTDNSGCTGTDDVTVNVAPLPTVSAGQDQTICMDDCIWLSASGGGNFVWSTGESGGDIYVCPMNTTTYTVTLTDMNGCTASDDVEVTVLPNPNVNITGDIDICEGECTTLTANGGISYLWSTGETTQSINPCPAATTIYNVTVTDQNGCTAVAEEQVIVLPLPVANAGQDVTICEGECTTLTATGGGTYLWSNSQTTNSIQVCPQTTTTYIVTVTGTNGCTASDDVLVTVAPAAVADAGPDVSICEGDCTILSASGNGNFMWSNGETTGDINACPSATTTYTLTVTTAEGCIATDEVVVTVNPVPYVSITGITMICEGECTTLTAMGGSPTGGDTYLWSTGETTYSIDVCPTANEIYSVTVTNTYNCSGIASTMVYVYPTPVADAGPDQTVTQGNSATLTASATGGNYPYSFNWSNGAVGEQITVTPTATATYIVTVTDELGCTDSDDVTVVVTSPPPDIIITEIMYNPPEAGNDTLEFIEFYNRGSFAVDLNGFVIAQGVDFTFPAHILNPGEFVCVAVDANAFANFYGKTAYQWTGGALSNGGETIELQDGMGTSIALVDYDDSPPWPTTPDGDGPSLTFCDVMLDNNDPNNWSASINFIGVVNGKNVYATPMEGCTTAPPLVVSAGDDAVICEGNNTNLNATVTGGISPYTYSWTPTTGLSDPTIANPVASPVITTTYEVLVTDDVGMTAMDDVVVTVNPLPAATAGPDATICEGDCVTLSAGGGTIFIWSTGETMGDINVCPAATTDYYVTVTDNNGCSATAMTTVTVNPLPVATAGPDATICEGDCVTLSAGGGTMFVWSTGETMGDINVCPAVTTDYYVTVTDNNGCSATAMTTVTVNPLPVASAGPDATICEGDCVTLSAGGGTMFVWSTGETMGDINVCPAATTDYYVTVTDNNGCSATAMATVTVNPLPVASAGPDATICEGDCVTLSAGGGTMFVWSTGETMGDINVCPTATTDYYVTVTDNNGCSATAMATVTVNPLPVADAGPDVNICIGACTDLTATGGVGYEWNTGDMTASINVCPTFNTTYTVTVTDANGCTDDDEVIVTVDPAPQITLQPVDQTVDEGDDAVFTVFAINATTYDWEVSMDGGLTWMPAGSGTTLTVASTTLAMDGYKYRCIVTGPCPPVLTSNVATLTVLPVVPPAVVTHLPTDTVCDYGGIVVPIDVIKLENVGAISLTMSYDPSVLVYSGFQNVHPALSIGNFIVNDVTGTVYVSWYTVGSVPVNILFGTLVELTFTSPAGGCTDLTWDTITPGYCEYADPFGNVLPSTYVDGYLCVKTGPTIITDPVDVTVEEGQPATFNVTANNALTYTWEVSEDGGTTWNIAGTGPSLTVSPTTIDMDGNLYRCVVVGECPPDVISANAMLTVNPIITTTLGTAAACAGDIVVPILVEHFYGVASLSYAFGYNTLALNYVGIQNVHSELSTGSIYAYETPGGIIKISWASLTPANVGDDVLLEVVFSAANPGTSSLFWDLGTPGNCEYTNLASDYITGIWVNGSVTVYGLPVAYNVTGGGEYCANGTGVSVGLSGSKVGVNYELFLDGNTTGIINAGTGFAFSFGKQLAAGTYTVHAMNPTTGCENDMNGSATIIINPVPVVNAGPDLSILIGTSATIDADVSGGTPAYTYLWAPGGQITEDITVSPTMNTTYTLTGTDSKGCMATDDITVTVYHNLISGYVNYDNAASTVMNNITVKLVDNLGTVVETTTTDATGYYEFGPHPNGTYTVTAESVKPWGGVNSTDALIIMEHFVGSLNLTGIRLIAADVNASGFVNAGDALFSAQRFAYVINSFPAGDWAFEGNTIVLNEANVTNNFLSLCFGDVNGSYTPPYVKVNPTVGLTNEGSIEITDKVFEVPVKINRDLELGAVSLIINYPAGLEILDVTADFDEIIYTALNNQLRVSWFNTAGISLSNNETLITLTVRASMIDDATFSLGVLSELADPNANVIENASINIPKLVKAGSIGSGYSINNYPNPFSNITTIEYSIAEDANVTLTVYNLLGETVEVLVKEFKEKGTYMIDFNGSDLNSGLYYYKIETSDFVKTKTMVINK